MIGFTGTQLLLVSSQIVQFHGIELQKIGSGIETKLYTYHIPKGRCNVSGRMAALNLHESNTVVCS